MKNNYDIVQGIFMQRAISSSFMDQILKDRLTLSEKIVGQLDYWFWRYVFMKDLTKKQLTNTLLKLGLDNLVIVEIIDGLNKTRSFVKDIIKDTKRGK